jgi:RNA polymerase sigma-70 factor (TIGR02957 family)
MDNATLVFNRLRPRLQGIAYRMLGSIAEAEEVVQDVWLRWHEAAREALDNPDGWLVTVTTRLAIDRYRAAKVQREHYVGQWLPEPHLTDSPSSPEQILERADELSLAFLMVLERLSPEARAAFVMREVFDADYADVARTIAKSEAACRQLVSRAKAQLKQARPRYDVPPDTHQRLLRRFADALTGQDFSVIRELLDDEAELIGDGGGRVPAFAHLAGGQRIAQLFFAASLRHRGAVRVEVVKLNGEWGLLRFIDGELESAQAVETDGERIVRIHSQRNPDKLVHIAAALGR